MKLIPSGSNGGMVGGSRMRRFFVALGCAMLLSLLTLTALPAAAQEQVSSLPPVNNFASARFDLLTTLAIGDAQDVAFGSGSTILPDRVSLWVGNNHDNKLLYYVQVGTVTYTNDGTGWRRADNLPPGSTQSVSISDQISDLAANANAILDMGPEPVRGAAAEHYQIWLSGDRLLEMSGNTATLDDETLDLFRIATYKVDLWIGQGDGLLHQQNVVLTIPEHESGDTTVPQVQITSLTTFYDFNDPGISIEPPL